jgi:carboxyl-terminal processing protease
MHRRQIALGSILLIVALSLGWQLGAQVERQRYRSEKSALEEKFALTGSGVTFREDPEKEVDLSLLWSVWRLLDRYYVDPASLTIDELRFGAVRGLVDAVGDAYTTFMTPRESRDFQQVLHGRLEGIGAELALRDGVIVVVAPLKGSPAARAGLLPQDVIKSVDEVSLEGVSLEEAVQRIRGQQGTTVTLGVFRPSTSEELAFSIVREQIRIPSVEYEVLTTTSGSLGYLAINQFAEETVKEAREASLALKEHTLSGVIVDLRYNGGGYLEGSIEIASLFLSTGKVVSVERRGKEAESSYVLGDAVLPDLPLAVLINEGTASASEIVAGALQDHDRATIIGVQSFGKGTVQEVIDLPGGSSLRVTVARWKTPEGRNLGEGGVEPDIEVPMTSEDQAAGRDPQKAAAIEWLLDGDVPEGKGG